MLAIATLPVIGLIVFGSIFGNLEVTQFGIIMAIGLIPAAVVPLPPTRRRRVLLPVVGVIFSVSMMVGSLLANIPIVAIVTLGVLAFLVSYASSVKGLVALSGFAVAMVLPLIGVGLSYTDFSTILTMSVAIVAGSIWVYFLSLFREATPVKKRPELEPAPRSIAVVYGAFYAATAMTAAIVAFSFQVDHIGWIVGAALFVMRPQWQLEKMRVVGRFVSVFIGANLAALILVMQPSPLVTALVVSIAAILAAATQGSRWYITPLFTTFIVFFTLLYGDTVLSDIAFRLNERVLETLVGVTIALIFGVLATFATKPYRRIE